MNANRKRVVIAGGSGLIGSVLAKELTARNHEVVVLTRSPKPRADGIKEVEWDGEHVGEWIQFLNGAEAVVNLTGKSINCPHTPENIQEMIASRVNSVNAIGGGIFHINPPPKVWVQASAIGFYGDQQDRICTEDSPAGSDTLAEICKQWEATFAEAKTPKIRKVLLRIGPVLARNGGMLPVLEKLTRRFLGGRAGSGKQFISWIHLQDLMRLFVDAIGREDMSGTFNAVAPEPATNEDFMYELREILHRPWSPPAPEWAVRFGSRWMKTEPSLALTGCRAMPQKLSESGFLFEFQDLRAAFKSLFAQKAQ